jgi:hypothetical protein
MSPLTFTLATPADDESLRRLLRENPIPGSISLSFEREPCYFNASTVEGSFHQTIVAREVDSGDVIAFGNRSIRPLYVNGKVGDIGYMSQLRVRPDYGRGLYLARGLAGGFRKYHELHQDGRTPFYLMSVIEDNLPAKRLLTSGLSEYPYAQPYARLFTYVIYPSRWKRMRTLSGAQRVVRGSEEYVEDIVECLNRNNARKQFAPHWTCDSLFIANLELSDFFLALDGERVVGCIARWDQIAFKQTVVRGYSSSLARWRKLLNMLSGIGAWPYLPETNTLLRYSYASHIAIDNDDPVIFAALLQALYQHNREHGYDYFMVGLAESNPLRAIAEAHRPLTYISQLYLVTWDGGQDALASVDQTIIPAPEIAVL